MTTTTTTTHLELKPDHISHALRLGDGVIDAINALFVDSPDTCADRLCTMYMTILLLVQGLAESSSLPANSVLDQIRAQLADIEAESAAAKAATS